MLCKYLYTHNIPLKNLSFVSNLKTDSILRKRLFVPFPEFFFVQREIKFQYFQCYVIFYIYIYYKPSFLDTEMNQPYKDRKNHFSTLFATSP